jgi:hypothetical protein
MGCGGSKEKQTARTAGNKYRPTPSTFGHSVEDGISPYPAITGQISIWAQGISAASHCRGACLTSCMGHRTWVLTVHVWHIHGVGSSMPSAVVLGDDGEEQMTPRPLITHT